MKFLVNFFVLCCTLALVAAQQYFLGQFPPARYFDAVNQIRDPRQNRGPVVFPPSPPDAVDESSGVVVGASGYGFVPPRQTLEHDYFTAEDYSAPETVTSFTTVNFYNSPYLEHYGYY